MDADQSDEIGFLRFTQIAVLRLLTNRAAMNGKPLTMREAGCVRVPPKFGPTLGFLPSRRTLADGS